MLSLNNVGFQRCVETLLKSTSINPSDAAAAAKTKLEAISPEDQIQRATEMDLACSTCIRNRGRLACSR